MPRKNTISETPKNTISETPEETPKIQYRQDLQNFSMRGEVINARQVSIALPDDQRGVVMPWGNSEYWYIRGPSVRGCWRDTCGLHVHQRMRRINPSHKLSTATGRMLSLGGVKSTGPSRILTPILMEQAKMMNPVIEMFGCSDPTFTNSCTVVSHMQSVDPIDRSKPHLGNLLQVVRRTLSRGPFSLEDFSDPEKIGEFNEVNRYRSQLEALGKTIVHLESILARRVDAKLERQLATAYADLAKLTKQTFTTAADVMEFVDSEKEAIRAAGHSTVSEQTIPIGQEVIPSGTLMNHSVHLLGASRLGCGLVMEGISQRSFLRPFVGGRVAQGAGGYLTSTYTVKRVVDDEWVDDCTIELIPEQRIKFHGAEHSVLKSCWEEWRDCDITQFDFTYEGMSRLVNGEH